MIMARLVVDTNSLIQCISRRSRYHELGLSFLDGRNYLCVTNEITPFYRFKVVIADPDDDKFVDCAVAGDAKYIVTDDHHYNVLEGLEFPRMEVIKLSEIVMQL